jgi:hypothetical protein
MSLIDMYLTTGAYKVTTAPKELYDAVPPTSPLTLLGSAPSTAFRCKVTVSVATGHTDCAGTITLGTETLTFLQAGTKQTTTNLSALPVVTYSGLDCHVLIECINSGGAPIQVETTTAIMTRIEPHQSGHSDASGIWTTINDTQIFSDTLLAVNDIVRKGTKNYTIKQTDDNEGLGGEVEYYTYLA